VALNLNTGLAIVAMVASIAAAVIIVYATRRGGVANVFKPRQEANTGGARPQFTYTIPIKLEQTITPQAMEHARSDLRALNIEREIVGYALKRLYESEGEGSITRADHTKLLERYKDEMKRINQLIGKKEMTVKLSEFESTQADLVQLFSRKFDELTQTIEDMRASLGTPPGDEGHQPPEEVVAPSSGIESGEPLEEANHQSGVASKILSIQEEVLKMLERLEQIEIEG
jgi:hypothetical protein